MESLCKELYRFRSINEYEFVKKLDNCLDRGGDINIAFQNIFGKTYILHDSIMFERKQIVKYALSRGADITKKAITLGGTFKSTNALEIAALDHESSKWNLRSSIFPMLKARSLELYSSYGLNSFHIDCAVSEHWNEESVQNLTIGVADVNATVSAESPLWPGMTPLLIAAKFEITDLVTRLLDLGANPIARDPEGNTPLHYLYRYAGFFDERLFVTDAKLDAFGSFVGISHFHSACLRCPRALRIVQRYLDQGVSPDLPIKECIPESCCEAKAEYTKHYYPGKVGLQLATENERVCPELIKLLLQYGADLDAKDSRDETPIDYFREWFDDAYRWLEHDSEEGIEKYIECIFLLVDAGSNAEKIMPKINFFHLMLDLVYDAHGSFEPYRLVLAGIKKLIVLDENLVTKEWKDLYLKIAKYSNEWNETEYVARCSDELEALTRLGLRPILDGTADVNSDFKHNFGSVVCSLDAEAYPIYGNSLRFKARRKLIEYERKKRKIGQAVSKVRWLFQKHGRLPILCAEAILWHMTDKELSLLLIK